MDFFLHTLFSTVAFRLEYVLFYQFYAKITTIFDQEKFGMAPLLYVDVEMFGGNQCQNRHTDVMHEGRLTPPHVRRHFLAPVGFTGITVGYARNYVLSQLMRLCYLAHRRPAKAQASLHIPAGSPQPLLFAHMQ